MSMPGPGQGRTEAGETVASFSAYEGAQKAVSTLISSGIPAREITIVGTGLRSIERITGRLGYASAARQGAMNGLLLGLVFSAIFVLGNPSVPISAFLGVMFIGIALGMLLSIIGYALMRRRRDYASVTQVMADHYDVTVMPSSIHRARQVLGPNAGAAAPPAVAPQNMAPPAAPPVVVRPAEEPPRYGERIAPTPDATPAEPVPPRQPAPEPESDEKAAVDDERPPRPEA